jgi:hypothetical protein
VAVVYALADGETLDDLDAHYECECGMRFCWVFSPGCQPLFPRLFPNAVFLMVADVKTARTLGTLDGKEGTERQQYAWSRMLWEVMISNVGRDLGGDSAHIYVCMPTQHLTACHLSRRA